MSGSASAQPESLSPELVAWRQRVFLATWLSYAGYYFARKPFFIAKPAFEEQYQWDPAVLGQLGSVYLIAYALGQFACGALGSRLGSRALVLGGMGISLLCNAMFGVLDSPFTVGLFLFVNGLAQASGWSGNIATMAAWFRRNERGRVMGWWATNFQVGGVLANTLAAWALSQWGIPGAFFSGSLVLLAIWGFFVWAQRDRPEDLGLTLPDPAQDAADAKEAADGGEDLREFYINVFLVGAFYFFVKFVRYALWSWTPLLLRRSFDLELDQAGYLSTLFDLGGIAGVITIGYLSDSLFGGKRTTVSLAFVGAMVLSTAALYLLGGSSLLAFGICVTLVGFFLYGPDALMSGAGAIDLGSAKRAALAAGIINGMGSCGSVVQEVLLGSALKDGGPTQVFLALLASSVGAGACLGVLYVRTWMGKARI